MIAREPFLPSPESSSSPDNFSLTAVGASSAIIRPVPRTGLTVYIAVIAASVAAAGSCFSSFPSFSFSARAASPVAAVGRG